MNTPLSTPTPEICARWYKRTRLYAIKLLGRGSFVSYIDDVVQDAWVKFMQKGLPEVGKSRYIFVTVQYLVMNLMQTEARRAKLRECGFEIRSEGDARSNRCRICKRPAKGRADLCEAHYYRERRTGTTGATEVTIIRKLSDENVAEIRQRLATGETGRSLSKAFGVGEAQISRIKNKTRRQ